MNYSLPIKEMQQRLQKVMVTLPLLVGNEVVNFSKDRFKEQAWRGNTLTPWKQRAAKAKRNKGRQLLILTGRLRRSIRITRHNNTMVAVGSDVPYARAHNEGFKGTVTVKSYKRNKYGKQTVSTGKLTGSGKERIKTVQTIKGSGMVKTHKRKMNLPQRQFLGNSPWLTKKLSIVVTRQIMNALKQ